MTLVNNTLCSITWTPEDVKLALYNKLGREATEDELEEALYKIDVDRLEEACIEKGWEIIEMYL